MLPAPSEELKNSWKLKRESKSKEKKAFIVNPKRVMISLSVIGVMITLLVIGTKNSAKVLSRISDTLQVMEDMKAAGPEIQDELQGGYYDGADKVKIHFPMAFSMTMVSWSVLEYSHKYKKIGEYERVRELIKWGTDYLLLVFDTSGTAIDKMYSQVGGSTSGSSAPEDHRCKQRPHRWNHSQPAVHIVTHMPELGAEVAAALASASLVFQDNVHYAGRLLDAAELAYNFAMNMRYKAIYSSNPTELPYYKSTGYFDELIWSATWMFYATANDSHYLKNALNQELAKNARVFDRPKSSNVLSWDNKLPGAELLLTRLKLFVDTPYRYEPMLDQYKNTTGHLICSYLKDLHGSKQLDYGVAFLVALFGDYMIRTAMEGWLCDLALVTPDELRTAALTQLDMSSETRPCTLVETAGLLAARQSWRCR